MKAVEGANKRELDKRIIAGKRPLTCLDVEQARKFEGKLCLFSSSFVNYKNIREYAKYPQYTGILAIKDKFDNLESEESPYRNGNDGYLYEFILPLEWVEEPEKKWRAYTIAEFQETFTVGRAVRFRRKDAPTKEHLLAFGGYYTLHDGRVSILFGIHLYTLEELFEQYEWQEFYTDEYRPFGIEETI